jgi:protoporphyrinogen oxidase
MADRPRIAILGAGPAGLGAAFRLTDADLADVVVLEAQDVVGGNAGSFEIHGQRVDFGSHRLHPSCDPEVRSDIERLLGESLLRRPRHGRINLRGKWIHFPLKPVDLLLRLDKGFAIGAFSDTIKRLLPGGQGPGETFESVLRDALGATICRDFYFPYARKIWGREPAELSATQAHRRVAANSIGKLIRKVLGQLPGVKPVGFGHFYYPVRGFGAISEAYAEAARQRGADLRLGRRVTALERVDDVWRVMADGPRGPETVEADYVWSTIPITVLARLISPAPLETVTAASAGIRYRQMILVYLTLDRDRYTEFDAHYFPGADVGITRLSEPKNYPGLGDPEGSTTLCAELPCSMDDDAWSESAEDLGERVRDDLVRVGLPDPGQLVGTEVRRLPFAYPIYETGYEQHFERLDEWAAGLPDLLTFGRQGLFAHDNTHHALYMAYCATKCIGPAGFDDTRWAAYRREFESHVVED